MENTDIDYSKLTKAKLVSLLIEKDAWAAVTQFLESIRVKGVLSETVEKNSTFQSTSECSKCPLLTIANKVQKMREENDAYQKDREKYQANTINSLVSENIKLKEKIRKLKAVKGMRTSTDHLTVEDMEHIAFDPNTPEKEAKKVLRQLLKITKHK